MGQTDGLAEERGPILVQLPPSLSFDASVVTPFLDVVRSPRKYWSRYDEDGIATVAATVRSAATAEEVWRMVDNTASGAAIENAWQLRERLLVV